MNSVFSTQAENFVDATAGGVDPRTGLYSYKIEIGQLNANAAIGPQLPLVLQYDPLDSDNYGYGVGVSIPITYYDKQNRKLLLSTGESYDVAERNNTLVFTQGKNISVKAEILSDAYKITHKNGMVELLTSPNRAGNIKATEQIISPTGRVMNLSWELNGAIRRLTSVRDETNELLTVKYSSTGGQVTFTVWPGTTEAYSVTLLLSNQYLTKVSNNALTPSAEWQLSYDSNKLLTRVVSPTGLVDVATYNANGHRFPSGGPSIRQPYVAAFRQSEISGRLITSKRYVYSDNNYLGYGGSNQQSWNSNSDYLYGILNSYSYWSREIDVDAAGNDLQLTERTYSNYHLLVAEKTQLAGSSCSILKEIEYYALKGTAFSEQPAIYQFPKNTTVTYTDLSLPAGQQSRKEMTSTEYDSAGNPLREIAADGTVTETTWYSAAGETGCPAEPNGFVRFMKSLTVTPPKTEFDTPVQKTTQRYARLGNSSCVVLAEKDIFSDDTKINSEIYSYNTTSGNTELGRLVKQVNVTYDPDNSTTNYVSTLNINSTVSSGRLKQSTLFTGHDGLTSTSALELSALSGLKYTDTSSQGVKTEYTYDLSGRIIQRTHAVGSQYEQKTTWQYAITDSGLYTTETLDSGTATRTWYNVLGEQTKQERYDPDATNTWYTISTASRDTLGVITEGSGSDHLLNGIQGTISSTINSINATDGWGNINKTISSEGITTQNDLCLVTLINKGQQLSVDSSISTGFTLRQLDLAGRPLEITAFDSKGNELSSVRYERDGLGRVCRYTDAEGNITHLTWDNYNRETSKKLADGTVITRRYAPWLTDDSPTMISVQGKNSQGVMTNWTPGLRSWDSLGRLVSETVGGRTTQYRYTGSSAVPSEVIAPSGDVINYSYIPELNNAVSGLDSGSLNQKFSYDPKSGLMISAIDNTGTSITRSYLPSGKLQGETSTGTDKKTYSSSRTSSLLGSNLTQTEYDGTLRQYLYDNHGRIISVEEPALIISAEYDGLSRPYKNITRDKATNETLTTLIEYDELGHEHSRTLTDSRGSTLIQSMERNRDGRMSTRETRLNNSVLCNESFRYDVRNRLINWSASGTELPKDNYGHALISQVFSHDVLGNITEVVTTLADGSEDTARFEYLNSKDPMQLTAVTHTHNDYPARINLGYDANGRLTTDEANRQRSYDALGRLTSLSDGKNTLSEWRYDGLDRTSEQVTGNTTRGRYYDYGIFSTERIYGSDVFSRRVQSGGVNLAVISNSEVTLCGTAQSGSLLWSRTAGNSSGNTCVWNVHGEGSVKGILPAFNGEHLDPATHNYALGNGYREYNPILMRFTEPDSMSPFGAGGINPYSYCDGDPANFTDPSGHLSWQAWLGIGLGIASLVLTGVTGGMSIVAAGSLSAALSSASTTTLVLGTISVVSDVTAIVSGSLEAAAPEASSILGWVSLATGAVGFGSSAVKLGSSAAKSASKAVKKAGLFVGDWQYKLQHAGCVPSKTSKMGSKPTSVVDRVLREQIGARSRDALYNRYSHGRAKPEVFYRGSEHALLIPPGLDSMDDRLVLALRHTSSTGGSTRGQIQSFTSEPAVAHRFMHSRGGEVFTVRSQANDVFMSTAEIIDLHADRLIAEKKILPGTVASAINHLFTYMEQEYFWIAH